jgi:phenylpropionate dioxygenase-like ring-hydroxylating dioxygenase large terminal subunit
MACMSPQQLAERLLRNVDAESGDTVADMMFVPAASYLDQARFERELSEVFLKSPLMVAMSCDLPKPGDFSALTIADRPIVVVRGDDGAARTFLNICRHRGAKVTPDCFGSARRFTCPYHFWVYDRMGSLVGNTAPGAFDGMGAEGLMELSTKERAGLIFATLTPGVQFDLDDWLGDMADALDHLNLNNLYRHRDGLVADSGNWKATADGYVDGYHLGYLHRNTIGQRSITNRNTYDVFGPHVRLGFANKPLLEARKKSSADWDLREVMSLVHFIFPNISISGLPGHGLMVSRILPGAMAGSSQVEQFQYFREPMVTDEQIRSADAKRELYFAVTRDEDFATVKEVTAAAGAIGEDVFRFGRNEVGNQNLHRWIDAAVSGKLVLGESKWTGASE